MRHTQAEHWHLVAENRLRYQEKSDLYVVIDRNHHLDYIHRARNLYSQHHLASFSKADQFVLGDLRIGLEPNKQIIGLT